MEDKKDAPNIEKYEDRLSALMEKARRNYLRGSNGGKIPGKYVVEYFNLLSDYHKDLGNKDDSNDFSLCAEFTKLKLGGALKEIKNRLRWKELLPRFSSDGDMREKYGYTRQNFEQAIGIATSIKDSPFKSSPPKTITGRL